ncbi:PQQ-dependent sugar dehydrogenase [Hymenobacter jeollabukensis]|uniref:Sorbosone dehydrogenase family protein n=1 Tax=Hymenobacter jeollabukensis TaxID=2025313 RepID=A0A5R8WLZ5_9BACT|nr:sorbosone dehydrogenase family protein [Hymenobacter jeollabukensis]TLM90402.1 sorbosone dehydrogenase family protein [Hymenobacter jeollabukensis]
MKKLPLLLPAALLLLAACNQNAKTAETSTPAPPPPATADTAAATGSRVELPPPNATKSVTKRVDIIDWPAGKTPVAPAGFTVTKYADGFEGPRWLYVLPNGDVLVAEASTIPMGVKKKIAAELNLDKSRALRESSANRITLLRDANKDGQPEVRETFLTAANGLNQPFGMLLIGDYFYVANTDGVLRFPYQAGQTRLGGQGQKIMTLPKGGYNNHWTRNLLAGPDGKQIYVSVGSGSNVQEHGPANEIRRANILRINADGSGEQVYASGLRNPVGMAWNPATKQLWTAVNERDELGDDLVPDYLTSVREGGFYGWPYAYFGPHEDPRRQGERPELVQKTIVPDVPLGPHTASLGLAFYDAKAFPAKYQGGAFIGQHGSWNRSAYSGYKVVFVPFSGGKPSGPPEDFLTGFLAGGEKAYGRPVGTFVAPDGALLVTDDAANTIWRVAASSGTAAGSR